ncbi:MAG TPA: N-acetyltransferase [Anaeromyxobacteraceae bacterium]|nr:N-acetyltransferase [Anaeromyxobacteraceae bacterium]
MSALRIEPVRKPSQVEAFIRFPFDLYRNYKHWVPPLLSERRAFLDLKKNPVFEYAIVQPMLALRGRTVVGTIAAVRNDRYAQFHPEEQGMGFFGLYEAVDDRAVSEALLGAAGDWLRAHGLRTMRGPVNLTTNDVLGLLVEGFDDDPALLMPYNPPYYAAQMERHGLVKAKDLFALDVADKDSQGRLDGIVEKLLARGSCTIRSVNLSRFREELEFVRRCYNEAWAGNWGFVPWTDRELEFMAKEFKPVLDPRLAFVGEVGGEPAAIMIGVPDANQALKLAHGRLLPFGLLRILWKLKVEGCTRLRVFALGTLPKYRRLGLDAILIQRTIRNAIAQGIRHAEVGWILEDNHSMLRPLQRIGARRTKVYRIYDKAL